MKAITGLNSDTQKNLMLGSGAFFAGYNIESDTVDSAKKKCIGATTGGGGFEAIPVVRVPKIDGVGEKAVAGLGIITHWNVSMKGSIMEYTEDNFKLALAAAKSSDEQVGNKSYKKIEGKNELEITDYRDNITFIGTIFGTSEPIIIQIFNVLNTGGLKIQTNDEDISSELSLQAHYTFDDLNTPPFAIYYPQREVTE